eukprot:Sdes_comp8426_c0_seq1m65
MNFQGSILFLLLLFSGSLVRPSAPSEIRNEEKSFLRNDGQETKKETRGESCFTRRTNGSSEGEIYLEELVLRNLGDFSVYSHYQFLIRSEAKQPFSPHFELFPRVLGEVIA